MWNGDKVKRLRDRYRETQEQFAARVGVSVQTIRHWEQDRGLPLGPAAKLLSILERDAPRREPEPVPA